MTRKLIYVLASGMLSATSRPIIWESHMFVKRNCALWTLWAVKHKNFKLGHLFTALYNVGCCMYVLDSIPTLANKLVYEFCVELA